MDAEAMAQARRRRSVRTSSSVGGASRARSASARSKTSVAACSGVTGICPPVVAKNVPEGRRQPPAQRHVARRLGRSSAAPSLPRASSRRRGPHPSWMRAIVALSADAEHTRRGGMALGDALTHQGLVWMVDIALMAKRDNPARLGTRSTELGCQTALDRPVS